MKKWIKASRPHTLPLALASIGMGNFIAYIEGHFVLVSFYLSMLTAILLQILSNLANDYGDTKHGADNEERLGPKRSVQSGEISPKEMKNAVKLFSLLSLLSGIALLIFSIPAIGYRGAIVLFLIGAIAIWAAYAYTAADKPYGYKGFGDLFVFIFFGLVSVLGTLYLHLGYVFLRAFLPAIALGFLSVSVLNLNNIRDIQNDLKSGKSTIANYLGIKSAKFYQAVLVLFAIVFLVWFASLVYKFNIQYLFLLPLVLLVVNLIKLFAIKDARSYYILLKQLSIAIFISVLAIIIGYFLY